MHKLLHQFDKVLGGKIGWHSICDLVAVGGNMPFQRKKHPPPPPATFFLMPQQYGILATTRTKLFHRLGGTDQLLFERG